MYVHFFTQAQSQYRACRRSEASVKWFFVPVIFCRSFQGIIVLKIKCLANIKESLPLYSLVTGGLKNVSLVELELALVNQSVYFS